MACPAAEEAILEERVHNARCEGHSDEQRIEGLRADRRVRSSLTQGHEPEAQSQLARLSDGH